MCGPAASVEVVSVATSRLPTSWSGTTAVVPSSIVNRTDRRPRGRIGARVLRAHDGREGDGLADLAVAGGAVRVVVVGAALICHLFLAPTLGELLAAKRRIAGEGYS